MRSTKAKVYSIVALAAIAGIAMVASHRTARGKVEQTQEKKMPLVVLSPVQLGSIARTIETTGTIESENAVSIVPKVEQRIVWMPFREGDTVHRGQVIARLESAESADQLSTALAEVSVAEAKLRDVLAGSRPQEIRAAEAALAQAEAGVESAKAALQDAETEVYRQRRMLKIGGASEEDVDKAQTRCQLAESALASANSAVESAKARLELLAEGASSTQIAVAREQVKQARLKAETIRTQSEYCTIKSPVNGVITRLFLTEGDMAQPKQPIMSISENAKMIVKAGVSDRDAAKLKPGMPALVETGQPGLPPLKLKVARVYPAADPATRLFPLEIPLPRESRMPLGAFARISLLLERHSNAIVVPADAIVQKPGGKSVVFVVENGTAQARPIEVGIESKGKVEVLSGLRPGESLVVRGQEMLKDGAEVKVGKPGKQPSEKAGAGPGQGSKRKTGEAQ